MASLTGQPLPTSSRMATMSDGGPARTAEDVRRLGDQLRSWARFGRDDELGTLNLVTAQVRSKALGSVVKGEVFSLSLPIDADGPQPPSSPRANPQHVMTRTGSDPPSIAGLGAGARYTDDLIILHLQSGTHWDALSHVSYDERMYNDVPAERVNTQGAHHAAIDAAHDRFVSRGVLLDVARLHGLDCLSPTHAIQADELQAAASQGDVQIQAGDIVLIRTGLAGRWHATGSFGAYHGPHAGVHYSTAAWFAEHDVAAVAADNMAVEIMAHRPRMPFHMLALRDLGMPLGELWDLEALAESCALDGQYHFLLSAPPLPVVGAVGAPTAPVVIK